MAENENEVGDAPVIKEAEFRRLDSYNQDEAIMAQERQIEKEIAKTTPLIGPIEQLKCLESEYSPDDVVYQEKIRKLEFKYSELRKTRGDGNCFFRAFGFNYMEKLLKSPADLEKFMIFAKKTKDELVSLGFPDFTIDDFYTSFMEVIEKVEKKISLDELLEIFNDQSFSDYIVVYLRLLTSGHLQKEAEFYSSFVEGGRTMKEFCHQEVEPMSKESDHIHITALTAATNVGVRIEYMDRHKGDVNHHDFPTGCTPQVYLLYRPGHYDILYP